MLPKYGILSQCGLFSRSPSGLLVDDLENFTIGPKISTNAWLQRKGGDLWRDVANRLKTT